MLGEAGCGRQVGGRTEGKCNENVLMGDHLGVREKPGDRKP